MIVVKVYFKDSIMESMSQEDILHPFLLIGNRKGFKVHLFKAECNEVKETWTK